MKRQVQRGFTILELVVTIGIIGILAGVAYPAYQSQITATRRADAQSDLMQLASFMERFFTENNAYDQDRAGNAVTLPFTQSPQSGSNTAYTLTVATPTSTTYTLTATPINAQAGDGFLDLSETGVRRWDTNNNGVATDPGESDWER